METALSYVQRLDSQDYTRLTAEDEFIDLRHFAELLAAISTDAEVRQAAQDVLEATTLSQAGEMTTTLLYEGHDSGCISQQWMDLEKAYGIAIYFPNGPTSWDYPAYVDDPVLEFGKDTRWDDFLHQYVGVPITVPGEPTPPDPLRMYRVFLPLLFTLPYTTGGYDALDVGDLDNDGDDDLAALRGAGYLTSSVVVYLQDSGHFSASYTLTPTVGGYLPHSLAVGDVDGDGEDDIVVTAGGNAPEAYLNVFLQEAGALLTTPVTYAAHHLPGAVAIGDLNHDGREDVVVAHEAWRKLSVYTQTVGGVLSPYATANLPFSDRYRPDALALADLDGNGGLDVALVDRDNGLIVLTNTLSAPEAAIDQPAAASVHSPGSLTVEGTADTSATAVEVRLRGHTGWQATTLNGTDWSIDLTLPAGERSW